jgi:prepilin peptidase CpaA
METFAISLASGALALSAYCDVRTRRIPDQLTIGVALAGFARIAMAKNYASVIADLAASAAVFTAAFLLFWRGAFGGGDVKLVAATTLLVGYHDTIRFLLVMSLAGAGLALCAVLRQRLAGARVSLVPEPMLPPAVRQTVPYGVAIAAAGIGILLLQHPIWG